MVNLERLASIFSLILCIVHSLATLLATSRTYTISVCIAPVWSVSSFREDDLRCLAVVNSAVPTLEVFMSHCSAVVIFSTSDSILSTEEPSSELVISPTVFLSLSLASYKQKLSSITVYTKYYN